MKISKIDINLVRIPLRTPFKTALRVVDSVEDIIIKITSEDGKTGYGEAPPTKAITGETLETIKATLKDYIVPAIKNMDLKDTELILQTIQTCVDGNHSAKAAVDMAIYDLQAKIIEKPLCDMLARENKKKSILMTDLTISVNPTDQMVTDSLIAVKRGFKAIKIKLGKEGKKDLLSIKEIRDAVGDEIGIRVDANQGWDPKEAVIILNEADNLGLNLEFVEQPVKARDIVGMAYVKKHTSTIIVADESAFSPEDVKIIFEQDAADMVNIKLMKAGGIYEAIKIADIASKYGKQCMVGCMLESKVAVSAAAHFAAAMESVTAIDLDGPSLCAEDPYIGGPIYEGPYIYMNTNPGIGITGILENYSAEITE